MKPHIIELERLDGLNVAGVEFEFQGALSVKVDPEPLEGVYESKLLMSRDTARKLHKLLGEALSAA